MRVLIAAAGVIGRVYGAHLAGAWHAVSVLSHPPRTEDVARNGLTAQDVLEGSRTDARVSVLLTRQAPCSTLSLSRSAATGWPQHASSSPASPSHRRWSSSGQPQGATGDQRSGPRVMSCSGSPAWAA